MAIANWPAGLVVRWRQDGYNFSPDQEPLRTDFEDGPMRARRRMSVRLGKVSGTLRFTRAEFADTFEPFWRNTLLGGSAPWNMSIYNGAALVTREVRSTAQYKVSFRGSFALVGLEIEVVNP
jgi:hypothetical protein